MLKSLYDNNKKFLIFVIIVISTLIIDTAIIRLYSFTTGQSLSTWRVPAFVAFCTISLIGQYLILGYAKRKTTDIWEKKKTLHLDLIYKVVTISLYAMTIIVMLLIFQIVTISSYDINKVLVVCGIAYSVSLFMIGLLALRFILWYQANRNFVMLLYGLSSAIIFANLAFSIVFVAHTLAGLPSEVRPHIGLQWPTLSPGSTSSLLNFGQAITTILSFVLSWTATAALLRHYLRKSGRLTFLAIIGIPLAYFLIQFPSLEATPIFSVGQSQPILFTIIYTLVFTLSEPIGGLLFGLAFLVISRTIKNNSVRNYLTVTAYGFALFFISNQAVVLVSGAYPSFGLATVSFVGLSSYLVLVGVYSSAVSVSQDFRLRHSIQSNAEQTARLLGSIGAAQMEQQIRSQVLKIVQANANTLKEESGIQPSLSQDDVKEYLDQVIAEIKARKSA